MKLVKIMKYSFREIVLVFVLIAFLGFPNAFECIYSSIMGILNRFMKNFIHFVVLFLKIFNKIQFKSQKYLKHPGFGVYFRLL